MKTINFTIAFVFLLSMLVSCTKKETNAQSASVTATIGTTQFTSSGTSVNVGEDPTPAQGGTVGGQEQVTITAESDASAGTDKDYLVIAFGYNPGDIKSYSVQKREAICAYHKSGSNDDIALTGTVTITSNTSLDGALGKHLDGTFNFTTQKGLNVSNGAFIVQVNN